MCLMAASLGPGAEFTWKKQRKNPKVLAFSPQKEYPRACLKGFFRHALPICGPFIGPGQSGDPDLKQN